ncbi:MAG TPA: sigma factor, partial [Bacillota bacterium]|nr:sigma factor [Bacillota bacterium]
MAENDQLPVPQARAGDPAAWDALFRRYQLPLYVYVFELVQQEQASLDIVQETFINAVRHLSSLREDSKFGSWLFGIAHQKSVQRWRKQTREESALEAVGAAPPEFGAGPDDLL